MLVEGNFFDGGNYTVYVVDGNNGDYFIKEIEFPRQRLGSREQLRPHSYECACDVG